MKELKQLIAHHKNKTEVPLEPHIAISIFIYIKTNFNKFSFNSKNKKVGAMIGSIYFSHTPHSIEQGVQQLKGVLSKITPMAQKANPKYHLNEFKSMRRATRDSKLMDSLQSATTDDQVKKITTRPMHASQDREKISLDLGQERGYHISTNVLKHNLANNIIDRHTTPDGIDVKGLQAALNANPFEKKAIEKANTWYMSPSERQDYQINTSNKNNELKYQNGQSIKDGKYIFVMGQEKDQLFIGKKGYVEGKGNLQHSSFLSGHESVSSGVMTISTDKAGQKHYHIAMSSGHYRPAKEEAFSIAYFLLSKGIVNPKHVTITKPFERDTLKNTMFAISVDGSNHKNPLASGAARGMKFWFEHNREYSIKDFVHKYEKDHPILSKAITSDINN